VLFSTPSRVESRFPELVAAIGLGALLAAFAFREGRRRQRLHELWTNSPVRMRLADGTWVDAGNLADAGHIMRTIDELAELPEARRDEHTNFETELD